MNKHLAVKSFFDNLDKRVISEEEAFELFCVEKNPFCSRKQFNSLLHIYCKKTDGVRLVLDESLGWESKRVYVIYLGGKE